MSRFRIAPLLAAVALASVATTAEAQVLDSLTLAGFRWRTVGPANFEGRVADIAGIPSPSKTFFVATAGGEKPAEKGSDNKNQSQSNQNSGSQNTSGKQKDNNSQQKNR